MFDRDVYAKAVLALLVTGLLIVSVAAAAKEAMVRNGTFEQGFGSDGVAVGWKGRSRGATFKPNRRLGRIGGGVYGTESVDSGHGDVNSDYQTLRLHGKVNLVDASRFDVVSKLHEQLGPEVITIAKLGPEPFFGGAHEALKPDPYANGRKFADYCHKKSRDSGHWARVYYGLNEPHMNDRADLAKVAMFELGFTERLHEHGMQSVVLNHSTGTPGDLDNMLIDEVRLLLATADFVGYHSYGGPDGQLMCHPKSLENFSLRWRKIKKMYDDRGWPTPPMIYTESTTWGGWHDDFKPVQIRDDLIGFSKLMIEDDWTVGTTVFCTGSWKGQIWGKWNIANYPGWKKGTPHIIVDGVRAFNMAHPVDAHSGAQSQEIAMQSGSAHAEISTVIETEPGKHYVLEIWLRYEFADVWPCNVEIGVNVDYISPVGRRRVWATNNLNEDFSLKSNLWNKCRAEFTAQSGRTEIRIHASKPKAGRAWIYVDDVSVRLAGQRHIK